MSRIVTVLLLACITGCGDPAPDPPSASAGAREPAPAHQHDAAGRPGNWIDPATVAVGDTVAGLRVTGVETHPLPPDSSRWTGTVTFEGSMTLDGVYLPHFDYPEVEAYCFHPDTASARQIPRFAPDAASAPNRKRWFCFQDPGPVREAFPAPARPREARIVIRDYVVHRYFTDAWDEADLVRVLSLGDVRENTLRDAEPQPVVGTIQPWPDPPPGRPGRRPM